MDNFAGEKGAEIRFPATTGEGQTESMFSRIKENILHECISIEHLCIISNGQADTNSDQVKEWVSSFENYYLIDLGNSTEFKIKMQVEEDYKAKFETM